MCEWVDVYVCQACVCVYVVGLRWEGGGVNFELYPGWLTMKTTTGILG